jgi:gluconolactonase
MGRIVPILHRYRILQIVLVCLLVTRSGGAQEQLYRSRDLTPPGGFASPEGPAVAADGVLYAVNFEKRGTIGRITPEGAADIFVELSNGSIGNGIRFDSRGDMLIADWKNHNVLRVAMATKSVTILAQEPAMNQPNDLAIGANDLVYASDPDWENGTGQLWRISADGLATLLEDQMGTTNGIEVSADE